MTAQIRARNKAVRLSVEEGGGLSGSTLLALSLFIILLAFFIVLNAISTYSEPKVDQAFESLDTAFSVNLTPQEFEQITADERQQDDTKGKGDSMEDMQGLLQSILPGLDMNLTDDDSGGKVMAVRMKKDRFESLTTQLIPLFIRILNVKDGDADYELFMISYVQDSLDDNAQTSYQILQNYRKEMVDKGLQEDRIALGVELGNPAYMMFQFDKSGGMP